MAKDEVDEKEQLHKFLKSQKIIVIASNDGDTWVANVYYGVDKKFRLYFLSEEGTKHSQQIMKNPKIAFSIVWFNKDDPSDRKAVQGQGICKIAETDEEIKIGAELYNSLFPQYASKIDVDWVKNNKEGSHIYIIEPTYMKYWDDELYGEEKTKGFNFD